MAAGPIPVQVSANIPKAERPPNSATPLRFLAEFPTRFAPPALQRKVHHLSGLRVVTTQRQKRLTHTPGGQTSTVAADIAKLSRRIDDPGDPGEALEAIVSTRRRLDDLEARHVDAALRAGWSWSRIAAALEVTKQAAHRKHSRRRRAEVASSAASAAPAPPAPGARRHLTITGEARRVVEYAREEASRLGAAGVGQEHLLLGLLRSPQGKAAGALAAAGVGLEPARARVDALASEEGKVMGEPPAGGRPPVLPEARQVFEQALREAVARGDAHLGGEHLLLALVSAERGGAAAVLARLEVGRTAVVRTLRDVLSRR